MCYIPLIIFPGFSMSCPYHRGCQMRSNYTMAHQSVSMYSILSPSLVPAWGDFFGASECDLTRLRFELSVQYYINIIPGSDLVGDGVGGGGMGLALLPLYYTLLSPYLHYIIMSLSLCIELNVRTKRERCLFGINTTFLCLLILFKVLHEWLVEQHVMFRSVRITIQLTCQGC